MKCDDRPAPKASAHVAKEPTYWWTASSGRIELQFTEEQAQSMPLSGDCESAAEFLVIELADQLAKIEDETLREELREYGAWDDEELQDRTRNLLRLVWLAASDTCEEYSL